MSGGRRPRDWSVTVWPALMATGAAMFAVPELIAYRSDPVEHPERLTYSRASKERWLTTRAARALFVTACTVAPWAYLHHLDHLPERKCPRGQGPHPLPLQGHR